MSMGNGLIAGVLLGSNSFHGIVVRHEGTELKPEAHFQESVQLAAGLDSGLRLSQEVYDKGLAWLERLARELAELNAGRSGAVATGVLRRAVNAGEFLHAAERILGMPVKVLSGGEEAFLTYVGVASTYGMNDRARLIIDQGGGSTELVVGRSTRVLSAASADVGCIAPSRRFFADGAVTRERFAEAERWASAAIRPAIDALGGKQWDEIIGAGGTVKSAGAVIQLRRLGGRAITREGLARLTQALEDAGSVAALCESILAPERIKVLPGGIAVLQVLFDELAIDRLLISEGTVREGLLVALAQGRTFR